MEIKIITITFEICETPNTEMVEQDFDNKYGILKENIEVTNHMAIKAYYPLYLIRRFAYALILAAFHDYPLCQLWLIAFVIIFPVFLLIL